LKSEKKICEGFPPKAKKSLDKFVVNKYKRNSSKNISLNHAQRAFHREILKTVNFRNVNMTNRCKVNWENFFCLKIVKLRILE
jgi:hypothetical protein